MGGIHAGRWSGFGGILAAFLMAGYWLLVGILGSGWKQGGGLALGAVLLVSVFGAMARKPWSRWALVFGGLIHLAAAVVFVTVPALHNWMQAGRPAIEPLREVDYGFQIAADGLVTGLAFAGLFFSLFIALLTVALLHSALRGGVRRRVDIAPDSAS